MKNCKTLPGLIQNQKDKVKRWEHLHFYSVVGWFFGCVLQGDSLCHHLGNTHRVGRYLRTTAFALGCISMGIQDSRFFVNQIEILHTQPSTSQK